LIKPLFPFNPKTRESYFTQTIVFHLFQSITPFEFYRYVLYEGGFVADCANALLFALPSFTQSRLKLGGKERLVYFKTPIPFPKIKHDDKLELYRQGIDPEFDDLDSSPEFVVLNVRYTVKWSKSKAIEKLVALDHLFMCYKANNLVKLAVPIAA
jgi:hypothetical protein